MHLKGGDMVLNSTFKIYQLYCGGQFNRWRKPEYQEKTTNLSEVTETLSITPRPSRIRTQDVSGDSH